MKRVYLDNAATTQLDPLVLEAMLPYLTEYFGNPSSYSQEGRIARLGIENARKKIAALLCTEPSQLIFTSGGTEANNLAIRGLVKAQKISRFVSCSSEHSSVYWTLSDLSVNYEIELTYLSVDKYGYPDLVELETILKEDEKPTLVSLMHANNEIGTMINLQDVGTIVKKYKAFFHSDAVQSFGHYPINLSEIPVDLLTMSAHKFHGPKGVGLLWMRKDLGLHVIQTGGAHEHGLRGSTENVAAIVGMAEAFALSIERYEMDAAHIRQLRTYLKNGLLDLGAVIHGPETESGLYTLISAGFEDNDRSRHLLLELDMAGISVSSGSACNTGKGSKVMESIGAENLINLRFSFSRLNKLYEIEKVLSILRYQLSGNSD